MVRAVRIEPSKPIIPADERQAGFNDTSAANPHGLLSLPTPRLLTNTQPVTDRTGDPSMLGVVDPVKQTVRSIARVARVGVVTRFASLRTSMAGPTSPSTATQITTPNTWLDADSGATAFLRSA